MLTNKDDIGMAMPKGIETVKMNTQLCNHTTIVVV